MVCLRLPTGVNISANHLAKSTDGKLAPAWHDVTKVDNMRPTQTDVNKIYYVYTNFAFEMTQCRVHKCLE